ncbi:MAG: hypothetical protein JO172_08975 [Hyphomicrobiales bacterium]|nr:hypothetical protein [Hyphomicrobiales bacterium]
MLTFPDAGQRQRVGRSDLPANEKASSLASRLCAWRRVLSTMAGHLVPLEHVESFFPASRTGVLLPEFRASAILADNHDHRMM